MLRSPFNRSALVSQLAAWQVGSPETPRQDMAERLGDWLNVADAITLHSANRLIPGVTMANAAGKVTEASVAKLQAEVAQVRAVLTKTITAGEFGPHVDAATDFPLYHQRYADQQRRMEMTIDALRARVRQVLSLSSPRLAQLAALDAVLAEMLGAREQKMLASVPGFLKGRFNDLRANHANSPDSGWLDSFEQEFQQTLLAELDLRLQAVAGMMEALGQETSLHA